MTLSALSWPPPEELESSLESAQVRNRKLRTVKLERASGSCRLNGSLPFACLYASRAHSLALENFRKTLLCITDSLKLKQPLGASTLDCPLQGKGQKELQMSPFGLVWLEWRPKREIELPSFALESSGGLLS